MTHALTMILFLLVFTVATPWADTLDRNAILQQAIQDFDSAVEGDENAVRKSLVKFSQLAREYPNDGLILAYQGSLQTMQARDAWAPWNKMRFAEQGLDTLDRALDKSTSATQSYDAVPYQLRIGLMAASTFTQMPKFFNRRGQAERLLNKIVNHTGFSTTPTPFQAQVWLALANIAEAQDQKHKVNELLKKAIRVAPESKAGEKALELLLARSAS